MTADEIITLSEITKESRAAVETKTTGIGAELEARLQAEIVTWNANRNKVKVTISGKVNVEAQNLLDAITDRVRTWLGFPPLADSIYSGLPGSVVVSSVVGW